MWKSLVHFSQNQTFLLVMRPSTSKPTRHSEPSQQVLIWASKGLWHRSNLNVSAGRSCLWGHLAPHTQWVLCPALATLPATPLPRLGQPQGLGACAHPPLCPSECPPLSVCIVHHDSSRSRINLNLSVRLSLSILFKTANQTPSLKFLTLSCFILCSNTDLLWHVLSLLNFSPPGSPRLAWIFCILFTFVSSALRTQAEHSRSSRNCLLNLSIPWVLVHFYFKKPLSILFLQMQHLES